MLAKTLQDSFGCRSLFHRGAVLASGFGNVCDNKTKKQNSTQLQGVQYLKET